MGRVRSARCRRIPSTPEEEAEFRAAIAKDEVLAALYAVPIGAADLFSTRVLRDHVWLEVPIAGGAWLARYRIVPRAGRPVVVEQQIVANGQLPPAGITSRAVVAEVKVSEHLQENWPKVRAQLRAVYGREAVDGPSAGRRRASKRGRPVQWDDLKLAGLAARYVEVCEERDRDLGVIATLAREFGASDKRVRNLLTQARNRRLLTRTQSGLAGGQLTLRARVLLTPDEKPRGRGGREK
jgi:hypothetical protein